MAEYHEIPLDDVPETISADDVSIMAEEGKIAVDVSDGDDEYVLFAGVESVKKVHPDGE